MSSSSSSNIWGMAVEDMCRNCANLYTGDRSCMLPGVPRAEQERRAAAGRCDSAAQTYNESGHTLRVAGSMVRGITNRLWEFVR